MHFFRSLWTGKMHQNFNILSYLQVRTFFLTFQKSLIWILWILQTFNFVILGTFSGPSYWYRVQIEPTSPIVVDCVGRSNQRSTKSPWQAWQEKVRIFLCSHYKWHQLESLSKQQKIQSVKIPLWIQHKLHVFIPKKNIWIFMPKCLDVNFGAKIQICKWKKNHRIFKYLNF